MNLQVLKTGGGFSLVLCKMEEKPLIFLIKNEPEYVLPFFPSITGKVGEGTKSKRSQALALKKKSP